MKTPRERVSAIFGLLGDGVPGPEILANLLGRIEEAATARTEGAACMPYAKRLCKERGAALWALGQAEAAAASCAASRTAAGAATGTGRVTMVVEHGTTGTKPRLHEMAEEGGAE